MYRIAAIINKNFSEKVTVDVKKQTKNISLHKQFTI